MERAGLRTTEERLSRAEEAIVGIRESLKELRDDIKDNRKEIDTVHGRINELIRNDIAHLKSEHDHDRKFWAKFIIAAVGGGGIGVALIECFFKYLLPYLKWW